MIEGFHVDMAFFVMDFVYSNVATLYPLAVYISNYTKTIKTAGC